MNERAVIGSLLGTAVGDALGLPFEGLSARRAARLFPDRNRHHLMFGRGMVSDDTEHACFVAQALIRARGDVNQFEKHLAHSLRWWLLALPAGIGFATLRAILRLWLGWPPSRSGVFSAGNGPAMRSALIGVAVGRSDETLLRFVAASTRITHTDTKAFHGALAVALAAHHSAAQAAVSPSRFIGDLKSKLSEAQAAEFIGLVEDAAVSAARGDTLASFATRIGSPKGISGYCYHAVPCVLHAWFRHPEDFARGLVEVISAGGDTDTAGAIYGGIVGARVGKEGIPEAWRENTLEWPRSLHWMERLAIAVAADDRPAPGYFSPGVLLRNIVFLVVVLGHGLRRLAPPY
jgi:ADP-ribosylglycohydrolase